MAAFFSRVGNSSQFHKTASTLKLWRISSKPNHKIFCRWNGQISARNYVTEAVTKRSSCDSGRFPGISCHKSVNYGRVFLAIQSGRCLSVWPWSSGSSSSANSTESELLQEAQTTTPTTTTTEMTNPFLQENVPETMLDSKMLKDMADAVTSLGEPTLASLGLGGFSPPGLIQQALELIHVSGNVSWFASIVALTFIIRAVCLPLMIKAQANTAKMNNIRPQLEEIQAQLRELANSYDASAKATASGRLTQLYKDNGCHPIKSMLGPLVQMPLFVSFFFALRKMSYLPVEAFKSGGHLWFQDLTVFDPYFILPVICSFSMLATVELGAEMGVSHPTMKTMKTIMRIFAVAMIPLTAQFPAALFGFWITSNIFTVGQVALLKHPAVRNAMGIPEMVTYTSDKDQGNFFENLKAGFKNSQEVAYIRHAEKMKHQRQKALGEAPLEPTYEFNPRIRENMEIFRTLEKESVQPDQLDESGMPVQPVARDPNFKPKRVKFNQEIFSGMMHRQAQKQRQKQRDKLRDKPGATM